MKELIAFLTKLDTLRDLVKDKPKNALKEAMNIFGGEENPEQACVRFSYFLQECPLLEGGKITEIIGADSEEAKQLRAIFLRLIDFKNEDLLSSMRKLFWIFFMNGETQVLDRVICQFSDEYIFQNPVAGHLTRTVRCSIPTTATASSSTF
jgi:hypothetical protein